MSYEIPESVLMDAKRIVHSCGLGASREEAAARAILAERAKTALTDKELEILDLLVRAVHAYRHLPFNEGINPYAFEMGASQLRDHILARPMMRYLKQREL